MPLRNSRLAAWGASTLVARSLAPARLAEVSGPGVDGKKFLATTPFCATTKKVKTGAVSAAHAERLGSPSRNGKPTATVPAPVRKARRFMAWRFTVHLRRGS
jgi:hypothetical protein